MHYWKRSVIGISHRLKLIWNMRRELQSSNANMSVEELWRINLEVGPRREHRHVMGMIPAKSRCKSCFVPFDGPTGTILNMMGNRGPSTMNPQLCKGCFENTPIGGAEIELTMLFADIRGSTSLAESMSSAEYVHLLNRFYAVATNVMVQTDALIDKFVGDEVIALYVPGYAGKAHASRAIEAAEKLLLATGHQSGEQPWVSVGVGIHTGRAFVGKIGDEGVTDITALGDAVNITARLASAAATGEIVVSDQACNAAGLIDGNLNHRSLNLKGKSEVVGVKVLKMR